MYFILKYKYILKCKNMNFKIVIKSKSTNKYKLIILKICLIYLAF